MREVFLIIIFLVLIGCDGQTKTNHKTTTDKMETFDIENFEKNKGRGKIYDDPHIYDYKTQDGLYIVQSKYEQDDYYSEEVSKEFSPYRYRYTYDLSGYRETEMNEFNNSVLVTKGYDKNGKLIKETNFDKNFKHTFEQIREIVLKEKQVDIYDTRQAVALRHDTPDATLKKYYQIHVLKSELVGGEWYSQPNYSFLIDDETGKIFIHE
ncbi:hypothetical protein [Chryseobacterium sp. ERMR1:04]|uniref:hypothetical protein n=1 Tax=Chryseobacterium sp. ERMR1:04 TaxID=1705393 RepID=UPI0006C87228|nr:hypothetical protein [Chryseobacterium sp. ERMR1:04]KPH14666.1 hypothetical protein AMQ68_04210 [Chryseobacterium sp. ERMR1:04]